MQINNNVQLDQSAYLDAAKSLNKIASGEAITQASDDASSLSISNKLQVQASGLSQSIDNVNSAFASLQIADGALNEQSDILNQVRENLLQASTDTTSQEGREALLNDIQKLLQNFDNIASSTNYNEQTLLQNSEEDNSASQSLQFQAGDNGENLIQSSAIQSNTQGVGLEALLNQDPNSFTSDQARDFLENVDNAINTVNDFRADLGSTQNQLESSARNLFTQANELTGASSIIQDIDYSQEVSNFSKQNILAQIGAYGAAQSNNINQSIVTRLLS